MPKPIDHLLVVQLLLQQRFHALGGDIPIERFHARLDEFQAFLVGFAVEGSGEGGHGGAEGFVHVGFAGGGGFADEGGEVAAAVVEVDDVEDAHEFGEAGLAGGVEPGDAEHVDEVFHVAEVGARGDGGAPAGADAEDGGGDDGDFGDNVEALVFVAGRVGDHAEGVDRGDEPFHRVAAFREGGEGGEDVGGDVLAVGEDFREGFGLFGGGPGLVDEEVDDLGGFLVGEFFDGFADVEEAFVSFHG